MEPSNKVLTAEPTYTLLISYTTTATIMYPANCFLNTKADVKLIYPSTLSREWNHCIKRKNLPTICTAAKEPLPLDGLILPPLCLGDLCTRIWFDVALHLTMDILLDTSFIDRFLRGIFPSERKILLWHSQPVAILAQAETSRIKHTSHNVS